MKTKNSRPTGVQFPLIYQAPINEGMYEFIKRAAWEMGKELGVKISLSEWGRRKMLPEGWPKKLAEWRKTQTDFDPNEFAGRKRLEVANGHKAAHAKRTDRADSALSKR